MNTPNNGKPKKFSIKVMGRSGVVKEFITIVDEEDAGFLRSEIWTVINGVSEKGTSEGRKYIAKNVGGGVYEYLHYRVLGLSKKSGRKVWHMNGDTLDNRKANLFDGDARVKEIE